MKNKLSICMFREIMKFVSLILILVFSISFLSFNIDLTNQRVTFDFGGTKVFAVTPAIPSGVTATSTVNSITVSWSAVPGATSYVVNLSGDHRTTTGTSFTYSNLPAGTLY